MPDQFTQYLLSSDVGFTKVDVIGTPQHRAKGFQRPIQVFTKPGNTPSRSNTPGSRSTPSNVRYTPYAQRTCVRRPVYTALTVSSHELDEEASLSPKQTFVTDFPSDGGQSMRVKFSPSDVEPCGTRLDVSEDIMKGSELSLPVSDVDTSERTLALKNKQEVEDKEMVLIEGEPPPSEEKNKPLARQTNEDSKGSDVKQLVSPV